MNVLVEPTESRVLIGNDSDLHALVGIGAGIPLPLVEDLAPGQPWQEGARGVVSEFGSATSQEAMAMIDRLAAEEGLLVGPSSGGACHVACEIARRDEAAGKTIVVILPSSGIRYGKWCKA